MVPLIPADIPNDFDWKTVGSIVGPMITLAFTIYLKLRDQLFQLKNESAANKVILKEHGEDLKTLKKDVNKIAFIVGTERAKAEERARARGKP